MRSKQQVLASVVTQATIERRKTRVKADQYDWCGDYCTHVDTKSGDLVVQVQLAGGEWKVARVSFSRLAENVVDAINAVKEEVNP